MEEPRRYWARAPTGSTPYQTTEDRAVHFTDFLESDGSENDITWRGAQGSGPKEIVRNDPASMSPPKIKPEPYRPQKGDARVRKGRDQQPPISEVSLDSEDDEQDVGESATLDPSIYVYRASEAGNTDVVAIHRLEWDLEPDLDDELEEYTRLARLGQFQRAQDYFDSRLSQHANHPLIFVRHAETLWEMGDFKSVVALAGRAADVFPPPSDPLQRHLLAITYGNKKGNGGSDPLKDLYVNWKLVYWISLSLSQNDCGVIFKEFDEIWSYFYWTFEEPTSTQLQIFYLLDSLRHLLPWVSGKLPWPFSRDNIFWLGWKRTYDGLKRQGRIWDFRNALLTHVWHLFDGQDPHSGFLSIFFDTQSGPDFCQRIRDDWLGVSSTDISILLALIDIFSAIALRMINHRKVSTIATVALRHADSLSEHLLQQHPELSNTSPLLHWLFARACVAHRLSRNSEDDTHTKDLDDLKGAYFEPMWPGSYTPYYIPIVSEKPKWTQPDMPSHLRQTLQMISRAAEGQHNWRLQASCLTELVYGTADPSQLLLELSEVQSVKQGELYLYTITCLTKYLTVRSKEGRKALRKDLGKLGCWETPHLLSPALAAVVAARDVVLSAMTPRDLQAHGSSIKAALRYYNILPPWFQAKVAEALPDVFRTYSTSYWYPHVPAPSASPYVSFNHRLAGTKLSKKPKPPKAPISQSKMRLLRELSLKKREIQLRQFQESEALARGDPPEAVFASLNGYWARKLSDIEREIRKLKKRPKQDSDSEWETEDDIRDVHELSDWTASVAEIYEGESSSTSGHSNSVIDNSDSWD
ncbi:hypothetical protein BD289DRAFT_55941 [Coniella lustricola]|uniref:Uncharacterized protein n=1 Tax=Coniella lustricola TaxID=2025994 RepID=A0A2T3AI41_9PEZI|nr:hypothetical protein BD289DRAFT_55941 [Coniella lustricola]